MEKRIGSKYESTKDLDIAEIAKLVRADIKAAVKSGELPAADYRVRISRFSSGKSLSVRVSDLPFNLSNLDRFSLNERGEVEECFGVTFLSELALEVQNKIEAITFAYNYDGSDPVTDYYDVRFYGHADVDGYSEERAARVAAMLERAHSVVVGEPIVEAVVVTPANDLTPAAVDEFEPLPFFG